MTEHPLSHQIIQLASQHGWKGLTLTTIAQETQVPLAELRQRYVNKNDILMEFHKSIDTQILSEVSTDDLKGAPPHDQIQELILYRFEVLTPFKSALTQIYKDLLTKPCDLTPTLLDNLTSLKWLLTLADVDLSGWLGFAKLQGLKVIYMLAFKTWLQDDSDDLASTMALLDKALRYGERILENYL